MRSHTRIGVLTPDLNLKIRVSVEPDIAHEQWDGTGVAGVVIKSADEKRYTLTVAYPANKPDADTARDGFRDFASPETIEDSAWDYMLKSRNVGAWHADGTDGAGEVVESYIYRGPDWTVNAADGSSQVIKAGDWLLGIRWAPDTWDLIKSGEIGGISMQGTAQRRVPDPSAVAGLRS